MNTRKAPLQLVLAIKRRLEQTNPAARLDEESVRLIAVPMTQFDATIFVLEETIGSPPRTTKKLIAEVGAGSDLPHIYVGKTLPPDASRSVVAASLIWCITHIGYRILHDPRFSRGVTPVRLNGFAHAH